MREEVDSEIPKPRKRDFRMPRRERLESVVNLRSIARADLVDTIHDAVETDADDTLRNDRVTHGEEMRTQAADGFFEDHLEARAGGEAVQQAEDAGRQVGERFEPDLSEEDGAYGDEPAD